MTFYDMTTKLNSIQGSERAVRYVNNIAWIELTSFELAHSTFLTLEIHQGGF